MLLLLDEFLLLSVRTFPELADLRVASTLLLVLDLSVAARLTSPSRALFVDDARAEVPAISLLVLFP